jgi:hypothetical protein
MGPGTRVEITAWSAQKGMRGTIQHKVGRRQWLVQLDQTFLGFNVATLTAKQFRVVKES